MTSIIVSLVLVPSRENATTDLLGQKLLDHFIRCLRLSVHQEGDPDRESTNDLFVLSLVSVLQHLVQRLFRCGSQHDETHGVSRSFSGHCRVLEEDVPERIVNV